MGCKASKTSEPKAAPTKEKTLLEAPAEKQSPEEMRAFISKSSVEELSAKLSAMSPEARSKIMSALRETTEVKAEDKVATIATPVTEANQ